MKTKAFNVVIYGEYNNTDYYNPLTVFDGLVVERNDRTGERKYYIAGEEVSESYVIDKVIQRFRTVCNTYLLKNGGDPYASIKC